jgi:YHS domain-containing protein
LTFIQEAIMTKDPVCGMSLDEQRAARTIIDHGKTYHFCSERCQATFAAIGRVGYGLLATIVGPVETVCTVRDRSPRVSVRMDRDDASAREGVARR